MRNKAFQTTLIPVGVENLILFIRDQKVILDADLAKLYGVSTKALNQAIKRNKQRFPQDFMFMLSQEEKTEAVTICDQNVGRNNHTDQSVTILRSQFVISRL